MPLVAPWSCALIFAPQPGASARWEADYSFKCHNVLMGLSIEATPHLWHHHLYMSKIMFNIKTAQSSTIINGNLQKPRYQWPACPLDVVMWRNLRIMEWFLYQLIKIISSQAASSKLLGKQSLLESQLQLFESTTWVVPFLKHWEIHHQNGNHTELLHAVLTTVKIIINSQPVFTICLCCLTTYYDLFMSFSFLITS